MELTKVQVQDIQEEVHGRFPEVKWHDRWFSPVWTGVSKNIAIQDKVAVLATPYDNEDVDEIVVGIGGKESYDLLPDEVVLYYMEQMLPGCNFGESKLTVNVNASHADFTWDFPSMEKKLAKVGDTIAMRIQMRNGSDVKTKLKGSVGGLCLRCTNGMVGFKSDMSISVKHMNLNLDSIYQNLKNASVLFESQMDRWKKLTKESISAPDIEGLFVDAGFGARYAEEIRQLPLLNQDKVTVDSLMSTKGKVNAWSVYSAMTQFLTHNIESEMVRTAKAPLIEKAFSRYYN